MISVPIDLGEVVWEPLTTAPYPVYLNTRETPLTQISYTHAFIEVHCPTPNISYLPVNHDLAVNQML